METAQQVELVPQDTQLTPVGDKEVEMAAKAAKKKDDLDSFVNSGKSSNKNEDRSSGRPTNDPPFYTWVEKGKGKGKGKIDGKKGKGNKYQKKKFNDKKKKRRPRRSSSS